MKTTTPKLLLLFIVTVFIVAAAPGTSLAQFGSAPTGRAPLPGTNSFGVRSMDFNLWCQQTQRYAAERCAARRAEDVRAFEAYRGSVERYELDYLKQMRRDEQVRERTNRDPSQTVIGKQDGRP
jgi:hypothetical protein